MTGLLLLSLLACDRDGSYIIPSPDADYPSVVDLGELRVISSEDTLGDGWTSFSDEARAVDELGRKGVHYGGLGASERAGYYGGATFNFRGTGDQVCVVLDAEAVFWNQALSPQAGTSDFLYLDNTDDDGDVDLNGGLTAYYTGSPGVEMGDFELPYTDPSGVTHTISFSECVQSGSQGQPANAGRGAPEGCTIDTSGLLGVSFTGVVDTFSLPLNDSVIHYAVAVYEGACQAYEVDECLLSREVPGSEDLEDSSDYCNDPDNEWNYACLEDKFCASTRKLNQYCEEHFDDDNAPCIDNGLHTPQEEEMEDGGI